MKIRPFALLISGIAFFAAFVAAQGAPMLDQQQLIYDGGMSARTFPEGRSVWQSFTAGISGTLEVIEMGFFNGIAGDAQLQILSGEGTGGTVLQTLMVSVFSEPAGDLSWNIWDVSVVVQAGQQYTFNFIPNVATMPDPYGVAIGASENGYAGGVLGSGDVDGDLIIDSSTDFDMVFRTRVDPVPEPSTGASLALGLLTCLCSRRSFRRRAA